MSEWQPIETAPRDKSYLLLYVIREDGPCCIVGRYTRPTHGNLQFGQFCWDVGEEGTFAENCVTHWMPLPSPPEVGK